LPVLNCWLQEMHREHSILLPDAGIPFGFTDHVWYCAIPFLTQLFFSTWFPRGIKSIEFQN